MATVTYNFYKPYRRYNASTQTYTVSLLEIFPVGAIYMSVADTDPKYIFGGTWTRIGTGRMLISAGGGNAGVPLVDSNTVSTYGSSTGVSSFTDFPVNQRGGELTHTLLTSELPSHTHAAHNSSHGFVTSDADIKLNGTNRSWWSNSGTADKHFVYSEVTGSISEPAATASTGGDGAHSNMPPYLAVYMWIRTA